MKAIDTLLGTILWSFPALKELPLIVKDSNTSSGEDHGLIDPIDASKAI